MSKSVVIVVVVLVIILLYLWWSPRKSESFTPNTVKPVGAIEIEGTDDLMIDDDGVITDADGDYAVDVINNEEDDEDTRRIKARFITRNTAQPGRFKRVNYADGVRGSDAVGPELENYFDKSNDLIPSDLSDNDDFSGYNDASGDSYAPYKAEKKKVDKFKLKNIFNSDAMLPQNLRDDWFEVIPEAISAKNRHLINVSKPIGINTIGTSLRNPSYDIRGSPPCPKFVVSPWMQSTIDQDNNLKSLC